MIADLAALIAGDHVKAPGLGEAVVRGHDGGLDQLLDVGAGRGVVGHAIDAAAGLNSFEYVQSPDSSSAAQRVAVSFGTASAVK